MPEADASETRTCPESYEHRRPMVAGSLLRSDVKKYLAVLKSDSFIFTCLRVFDQARYKLNGKYTRNPNFGRRKEWSKYEL